MIKYPVKARKNNDGTYSVEATDGRLLAECQVEDVANLISDSLNAMNEFPGIYDETPPEIVQWYADFLSVTEKEKHEKIRADILDNISRYLKR